MTICITSWQGCTSFNNLTGIIYLKFSLYYHAKLAKFSKKKVVLWIFFEIKEGSADSLLFSPYLAVVIRLYILYTGYHARKYRRWVLSSLSSTILSDVSCSMVNVSSYITLPSLSYTGLPSASFFSFMCSPCTSSL